MGDTSLSPPDDQGNSRRDDEEYINLWDWGIYSQSEDVLLNGPPTLSSRPNTDVQSEALEGDFVDLNLGGSSTERKSAVPDLNTAVDPDIPTAAEEINKNGPWNLLTPGSIPDATKWKALMLTLGVEHMDPYGLDRSDIVGRRFDTYLEAELFFTLYAKMTGFSIRKGHKRSLSDGRTRLREWLCSREGKRMEKHMKRVDRVREAKPITRVSCPVKLRVSVDKKTNKWVAREFICHHSHELPHESHMQFLRSNRRVTPSALRTAISMRGAGIRTCQIMSFMAELAGGYHRVPFSRTDLDNRINEYEQIELSDADASKAIGFLTYKVDNDPGFYAKYSFDEYNRLQTVIWSDSQCKQDYRCFGHAIAFDTTYKTNDYGKPLLLILGINHHFRSTILGIAILVNETSDTYKWVIQAFLECMNGVIPETVMTDGDNAMKAAVTELMPTATHRICTWHIRTTAARKVRDPNFVGRLNKLMLRYYSEERFETEWAKMVDDFALHNNSWVTSLYSRRHLWAESYVRGPFFGGMTTTQRCESMNSYVKRNLPHRLKLSQFVRIVDQCVCRNRQNEAREDYESKHTSPVVGVTNMPEIESQAAKTYTRRMFVRVREEIKREGRYLPIPHARNAEHRFLFRMNKYTGRSGEERYVAVDQRQKTFECSCNKFPSEGIPCRHMFAVMKHMQIKGIPDSLLLRRWTKEAKSTIQFPTLGYEKSKVRNLDETSRFGFILARCSELAYLAAKNDVIWKLTTEQIDKVVAIVGKAMAEFEGKIVAETGEKVETIPLRNPLITKGKGAPPTRNTGLKRGRKCSNCNRIGHNKATCMRKRAKSYDSDCVSPSQSTYNEPTIDLDEDEDGPWEMETEQVNTMFFKEQSRNTEEWLKKHRGDMQKSYNHPVNHCVHSNHDKEAHNIYVTPTSSGRAIEDYCSSDEGKRCMENYYYGEKESFWY